MMVGREANSLWKLLRELSTKAGITEVIINSLENIYIEREGEFIRLNAKLVLSDIQQFCTDVAKLNNRQYGLESPILDGRLPDGSRINIIHELYTSSIPAITIRKYLKTIKTFDTSPDVYSAPPKVISFLKALVTSRQNVVISGGTGAGKTTMLNLMLQEVPVDQRIVSIEDTRELSFPNPNKVQLESRLQGLTIRELLKNALRMRPDRIIIGEIRGGELFDLLQAMNTGHKGSMTSLHANSPGECLIRMDNLFLLSGYDVPQKAVRFQISSAVDFIVQIMRTKEGKRVISKITEVTGMESERITLQDIVSYDPAKETVGFTGLVPKRIRDFVEVGLTPDYFQESRSI